MDSLLSALKLSEINSGCCFGADQWSSTQNQQLASYNPADETLIAKVNLCSQEDYVRTRDAARQAFLQWRLVPAPQRGELVRQIADELRRHKDTLGSLVALEMGKSKVEGDGEVQEMIDMAN